MWTRVLIGTAAAVWLGMQALGIFAMLFGGIHTVSLVAGGVALAAGAALPLVAPHPRRAAGWALAGTGALWLLLPLAAYSHRVVLSSAIKLDDRLYGRVIAGGPGTDFTGNLGLVLGALLILAAVVLVRERR